MSKEDYSELFRLLALLKYEVVSTTFKFTFKNSNKWIKLLKAIDTIFQYCIIEEVKENE